MGPRCSCVKSNGPATAKDDHAGPTGIFHNCSGGCIAQFVEMGGPTTRPARSEPRNPGHSGWARLFAYFSAGVSAGFLGRGVFVFIAAADVPPPGLTGSPGGGHT